jgi:hypothetical protein
MIPLKPAEEVGPPAVTGDGALMLGWYALEPKLVGPEEVVGEDLRQ